MITIHINDITLATKLVYGEVLKATPWPSSKTHPEWNIDLEKAKKISKDKRERM